MIVRTLSMVALLLLAPLAAAEAAPRPAPDAAALSAGAEFMASHGHGRHRRLHRHHRRHHVARAVRPWWLVTRPIWPGCYDRYPFYCAAPERSRYIVRHRHPARAVLSVRG